MTYWLKRKGNTGKEMDMDGTTERATMGYVALIEKC